MSWISARIDLSKVIGSSFQKDILEDRVEDVFRLLKQDSQVNSSGNAFVNAVQVLDPEHFRGSLLRRPFQAVSDIIIDHPDAYAAILYHEHLDHPHKTGSHLKDVLEFHRHDEDLVELPPIVIYNFQQKSRSFLPCEPACHSKYQIRLSVAIRKRPGSSDCAPPHIGIATAYRWHSIEGSWPEFVVAQGRVSSQQWLLNVSSDSSGPFFKFWKTQDTSDMEEDTSECEEMSQASHHSHHSQRSDPEIKQKGCISHVPMKSAEDTISDSDLECVDQVLHGLAEDASDVRQALLNPKAIQKVCK